MAGRFRLGHPQLDALDFAAVRARGCLGMGHSGTGRHQIQLAGSDQLLGTKTVAMQDFPGNEPGDRLEAHMGMWPDAHCLVVVHLHRAAGFAALFIVRPAWAFSCGCKSRRKLVTVSEVKRNRGRVTDRGEEAWIATAGR